MLREFPFHIATSNQYFALKAILSQNLKHIPIRISNEQNILEVGGYKTLNHSVKFCRIGSRSWSNVGRICHARSSRHGGFAQTFYNLNAVLLEAVLRGLDVRDDETDIGEGVCALSGTDEGVLGFGEVKELDQTVDIVLLPQELCTSLKACSISPSAGEAHIRQAIAWGEVERDYMPHPEDISIEVDACGQIADVQAGMVDMVAFDYFVSRAICAKCHPIREFLGESQEGPLSC